VQRRGPRLLAQTSVVRERMRESESMASQKTNPVKPDTNGTHTLERDAADIHLNAVTAAASTGGELSSSAGAGAESSGADPGGGDARQGDAVDAVAGEAVANVPDAAPADDEDIVDTHAYLKGLLEVLLFVSDHPLTLKELARAAKIDRQRAQELVEELRQERLGRGIRLEDVGGGFVFRSSPVYAQYVRNFLAQRPVRLSRAQLETLSIIAYRQPITRPEVDAVRGVDSGPVIKGLLERELIRILGKKDEPGRPMLYGTSPVFLELFGLKSLRELPTLKEFTELSDDSKRKFEQVIGDDAPEGAVLTPPEAADAADEDIEPAGDVALRRASAIGDDASRDDSGVVSDATRANRGDETDEDDEADEDDDEADEDDDVDEEDEADEDDDDVDEEDEADEEDDDVDEEDEADEEDDEGERGA
jgi:segregation and condensation protein B